MKKRFALISVFTKDAALLEFVDGIISHGFEIVSSGGTAKFLSQAGIVNTDVREITGYGPVLDHKVVTLAPQIHGGLLASNDQLGELEKLNWPKFGLLYVTFYPLREELNREGSTFESCIKKCDIGGPTMVRSANKGGEVIVMTDPSQQKGVLQWLNDGEPNRREILDVLRGRAEQAVAEYVNDSAQVHGEYHDLTLGQQYGL